MVNDFFRDAEVPPAIRAPQSRPHGRSKSKQFSGVLLATRPCLLVDFGGEDQAGQRMSVVER